MTYPTTTARPINLAGRPPQQLLVEGSVLARPVVLAGRPSLVDATTATALLGRMFDPLAPQLSGLYRLQGVTRLQGAPVQAVVVLIDSTTGQVLRRTLSRASDGMYSFARIGRGPFVVFATIPDGDFSAVIADNLYAEKIT